MVDKLINAYYTPGSPLHHILITHSKAVRDKALEICVRHPELNADTIFIAEAAMLHDIGIFMTHAPGIQCVGDKPYICHGYLGRELLELEGFPKHALVCERHTGTGLTVETIISQNLPIPHRNMRPVSVEEEIICFADKFFSKSRELTTPKTISQIRKTLAKHGTEGLLLFDIWCERFL